VSGRIDQLPLACNVSHRHANRYSMLNTYKRSIFNKWLGRSFCLSRPNSTQPPLGRRFPSQHRPPPFIAPTHPYGGTPLTTNVRQSPTLQSPLGQAARIRRLSGELGFRPWRARARSRNAARGPSSTYFVERLGFALLRNSDGNLSPLNLSLCNPLSNTPTANDNSK
jgi:hypothetical protein